MLRVVGLATLALGTLAIAVFVIVEARTPTPTPMPMPSAAPSPASLGTAPRDQPPASARPTTSAPSAQAASGPPAVEPADTLDRVVDGKSRREWHAIYAARQRRLEADITSAQEEAERAGEGTSASLAAEARVRELRGELKRDLESLSQIDHAP